MLLRCLAAHQDPTVAVRVLEVRKSAPRLTVDVGDLNALSFDHGVDSVDIVASQDVAADRSRLEPFEPGDQGDRGIEKKWGLSCPLT
jgi:hypothetical protein